MKKRKELDALVSSRAPPGRELLKKNESESSDMEDYTVLAPYRLPPRKKHNGRGSSRPACIPACLVLVAGAAAAGALVWLHLGLRRDFDTLRSHLNTVDAENKQLPGTLHDIHSQLKQLKHNMTSLAADLKKATGNAATLAKEVSDLKATTSDLHDSVAAAPQIKALPNAVEHLKKNVANLGSQVSTLESNIGMLKEQHAAVQGLEARVAELQGALNLTSEMNETLFRHFGDVETCMAGMNASLTSVLADVRHHDEQLEQLKETCGLNCTQTWGRTPEETVQQIMGTSDTTQALREAQHLVELYKTLAQRLNVSIGIDWPGEQEGVGALLNALTRLMKNGAVQVVPQRVPQSMDTTQETDTTTIPPPPRVSSSQGGGPPMANPPRASNITRPTT
ncbi:EF-hand calcium-binding domain-containing protein 14-like isoform X2 [Ornithodoros turicata]|uniref:EF-hand calcium-binding domain-containing protein 14-like isoform X2 n=1 Tax=Ornithodoros turicata TaxID=34597 RepID=UPI00313874E7